MCVFGDAMLHDLQVIYDTLYNGPLCIASNLKYLDVVKFLVERDNKKPNSVYNELLIKVKKLKSSDIDPVFIERFCLAKITNEVLDLYPVNIAEAYVVSYVLLNKNVGITTLYFKLGHSGLLTPALINGERVENTETISTFIVKSLYDADLIKITEHHLVMPGKKLQLEF